MPSTIRTSTRKRTLSDASNASTVLDDLPCLDDVVEPTLFAKDAAAAAESSETRRSDPIADCEVDAVYEELYAQMESEAMLSLLADLEREVRCDYLQGALAVPAPDRLSAADRAAPDAAGKSERAPEVAEQQQLLWHLTATPTMMRELAQHVAESSGGATASQPAAVSVSG